MYSFCRILPRQISTYHVRGDLASNVTDKEDGEQSLEFPILEFEVDVHVVQTAVGKRIAVEEVEKVHDPEQWLRRPTLAWKGS
jgi:hypothetical protein